MPAGVIEMMVVDQLRGMLGHPDMIARTYREVQDLVLREPGQEATDRLEELRQRRKKTQQSIRVALDVGEQDDGFLKGELKRLQGELKSLERAIRQLEPQGGESQAIELDVVSASLQRIGPVWDVLYPEEQRRVLELLIERIIVSQTNVEVRFRTNGIEQIVEELKPIGERASA